MWNEVQAFFAFNKMAVRHLPGTIQRARHFLAGGTISATDATLIKPLVRTNDTITPSFDTLALDTNCGGVWAAGCAISHLGVAESHE